MKKKIKILIIDDDETIRTTLARILKEENYNAVSFETGESALNEIKKQDFNIAIVDLKLPDIDGLSLLDKIRKRTPDICGIIITAYPEMNSAISAVKKQAYDYIIKPFDVSQIKMTIKRCIEKQRLERENKMLLATLSDEKEKLTKILHASRKMCLLHTVNEVADFIVKKACTLLKAEKGSLMLIENDRLLITASQGLDNNIIKKTNITLGKEVAGWVAKYGHPLLVKDIENDLQITHTSRGKYKSKSFLSFPLKIKNQIIGVINITDKIKENKIFESNDLKYLAIMINQGAAVIESAKLFEKLNNEAITDSVTGVFNHRYFKVNLQHEINRALRYSLPLSLIMIDIDIFKKYNDTYGHIKGDVTLKLIASIIKNHVRTSDIVCRYGGDEFVIISPHTDISSALKVAEKLRSEVERYDFCKEEKKKKVNLTLSLGVSTYQKDVTEEELIQQADHSLYRSKKAGRNTVTLFVNNKSA